MRKTYNGPVRLLLTRLFPRYRLRRICRALELRPFGWQRDFALAPVTEPILAWLTGRGTGKTTAVLLRLLMQPEQTTLREALAILLLDPDFTPDNGMRVLWMKRAYSEWWQTCQEAGIRVPGVDFIRLAREARQNVPASL